MPIEPSSIPVDLYESGRQITSSRGGVGRKKCKSLIPHLFPMCVIERLTEQQETHLRRKDPTQ
jgi:hypothetical protein